MKCAVHSEVDATGFCRNCGKPLCPQCTRDVRGALYCEDCLVNALSGQTAAIPKPDVNPGAAAALGLIPGLGAVYNGEYTKAIIHVAVWGGLFAIGVTGALSDLSALVWIAFGIFPVYMSLDAYRVARARQTGAAEPAATASGKSSLPIGAFVLIVLGVLALLGNFGLVRGEWIDKGWPLILIAIGAWLLVKRTRGGS
ncbi:MAG: B-box zinc finger protein [Candidatus Acidiferrales bacterium]